ncbi:DDE-type integrase/transposase/recombinase [Tenacibaculum maritimum]|nr:DDE-type integrase/transposase/recombinase [Tenacibaculum maritimum]MDB0601621.1 DDE-type integrase/transposase/recombinase [Tenacibaculum maritimum]MDB0601670.1 DDE-type integrase/transposase/recombinase [Tenacibaculum maritimum]MDB0612857.1 DDE-type integrase/transposase/recombinase [Tenacibaculum maritimum]
MLNSNFLPFDFILKYGVSESYLWKVCSLYRQGKSKSWCNIKDSSDKRKVLIDIDSIPPRTRVKYNIPTGVEYIEEINKEHYLKKYEEKKLAEQSIINRRNKDIDRLYNAYHTKWMEYYPECLSFFKAIDYVTHQELEKKAQKVARNYAFWYEMIFITGDLEKSKKGRVKHGFECFESVRRKLILYRRFSCYFSFTPFLAKVRKAVRNKKSIIKLVATSHLGKSNALKTTDFHKSLAVQLLCNQQRFTYPVVTDLVNHHCKLEGLATISEGYIKLLMTRKSPLRNLITAHRNGEKRFNDEMASYTIRKEVTYPANAWMIDGTPLQFFCWNKERSKILRLNLFVVIDACTRKIVGFDIAKSEDKFNVMAAIKLAVKSEGHLPAEIVSDNFSANKTDELRDLQQQMINLGCYWRFSKVGNAQDKGMVERFFGLFQTMHCSLYQDYLGEGITSKRDNRPSKEFMLAHAKKHGYATYEQMMLRIATSIGAYNQQERVNSGIPNNKYKELPKPNAKSLDAFKTALLFWKKTSNTIRRSMVKITIQKIEYFYDLPTNELKLQLHKKKVTVRYDEKDLSTVMLFDNDTDTPICECKQIQKVVGSSVERTEKDEHLTVVRAAKQKSFKKYLKDKKQVIIDKGLEQVGKDSLPIPHPASLEKHQIQAFESENLYQMFAQEKGLNTDTYKPKKLKAIDELKHSETKEYEELAKTKTSLKGSAKPIQQHSY